MLSRADAAVNRRSPKYMGTGASRPTLLTAARLALVLCWATAKRHRRNRRALIWSTRSNTRSGPCRPRTEAAL